MTQIYVAAFLYQTSLFCNIRLAICPYRPQGTYKVYKTQKISAELKACLIIAMISQSNSKSES